MANNTMMKLTAILLFVLSAGIVSAQHEVLNDLITNESLIKNQKRNVDGTFIYYEDTIDLPIRDDFSTNKFVPYDAQPGDANVLDSVQYLLWDTGLTAPIPLDSFATDTTFLYQYDTLSTADSVVSTRTAFSPTQYVLYDVSEYPFTANIVDLWPPYNVHDSSAMITGDVNDTTWIPDLWQDSVTIYLVSPTARDTNFIWVDNYAYRNSRYPIDPPTVGVATFDGLDENGYPYSFGNVNAYEIADYLTSKPISMASHIATSTYLSFFYQSTGLGNEPEGQDSLTLEFWVPDSNAWQYVWSTPGVPLDTFEYVQIELNQNAYFADGFRFRFKNYASTSGNLDHWHIDYVYLNDRPASDSIFADVAFQYESYGVLNDYTAMPWKHYKWDPDFYTVDTSFMTVYNNNNVAEDLFAGVAHMYTKYQNALSDSVAYVTGATNNVNAMESKEIFYPEAGFILDTAVNDTMAIFDICHTIETDDPYFFGYNDTVRFEQVMSNYYAYDDGTAEAAYGIYGSGAQFAYQFEVAQPDSIRSIMIHWAPSANDVSQNLLRLTIWEDDGSGKPGNILYQTDGLFGESPIYSNKANGFVEYFLKDGNGNEGVRIEVSGTYYIGWVQTDPDVLNIGFDRNLINNDRVFYNVGAFWTTSSYEGSPMMRPVFVSQLDGFLGVPTDPTEKLEAIVYPNPSNASITLDVNTYDNLQYQVLSITGALIDQGNIQSGNSLNISDYSNGLYFMNLIDDSGRRTTIKFLKN